MSLEDGIRPLEAGVRTDLGTGMSYGRYLELDAVLDAQHPKSDPPHPDEMLFIIQHQVTELWLKLTLHELRRARGFLDADALHPALKCLARVKHVQRTLTEQWSVLATLTPTEYAQFRGALGSSSGFQSAQYRAVEFILGNKNAAMLPVFDSEPAAQRMLAKLVAEPTLYDAFLRFLARAGHPVPAEILDRDVTRPWVAQPELIPLFRKIYERGQRPGDETWGVYEACEDLVDLEDNFQAWRFRHLRTVQRVIGFKSGTGGSSGVAFLRRAMDLSFFPELFAVRTEIGA
jgi:tryptophan 2,3-dioxygenase